MTTIDPANVFTYEQSEHCVLLRPLKASAELRYEDLYGFTLRAHLNAFFSIQRYHDELYARTQEIASLRNMITTAVVHLDFLNNQIVHAQQILNIQNELSDEDLREFLRADDKELSDTESRDTLIKRVERLLMAAQSAEAGLIAQKSESELRLEEIVSGEQIVPRTYGLTVWQDDKGAERYLVEGVGKITQAPDSILKQMVAFILSTAPKIKGLGGEGLTYQTEPSYMTFEEIMDTPLMQRLNETPPGDKNSIAYQLLLAANLLLVPENSEVTEDPKQHSATP